MLWVSVIDSIADGIELADDAVGGGEYSVTGFGHDRCRISTADLAGPSGDVREGVVLGGDAGTSADEVGDRLRLDLDDPAAVTRRAVLPPRVVETDVTQFVSQRPRRLGVVDIGAHPDDPLAEIGVSVGAVTLATLDGETRLLCLGDERIPHTVRCLPT
jgi:hypothetical protein